jgi:hypothetical protein
MKGRVFMNTAWMHKPVKDLTLQDVIDAYAHGFYFVYGDGKIKSFTRCPDLI